MSQRPMPKVDSVNRPFWEGCNAKRLVLQHCHACRKTVYYPRVCCPYCHGDTLDWEPVSGNGRIVSDTLVYRHRHEGFMAEAPVLFAAVRLDEGPVIFSRITQTVSAGSSLAGRPVRVVFSEPILGQRLPYFSLMEE